MAASQAIPVDVTEVRTLNPGGALPVALLVPLILLGGLFVVRGRPRLRAMRSNAGEREA